MGVPGMGDDSSDADMSDSPCGDVMIVVDQGPSPAFFVLIGSAFTILGYFVGRSS